MPVITQCFYCCMHGLVYMVTPVRGKAMGGENKVRLKACHGQQKIASPCAVPQGHLCYLLRKAAVVLNKCML